MTEEKKRVFSSIIAGGNKVDYFYKEYIKLRNKLEENFDVNLNIELQKKLKCFKINLCNYANAIIDKKEYFTNTKQLDNLLDEKITPVTLEKFFS